MNKESKFKIMFSEFKDIFVDYVLPSILVIVFIVLMYLVFCLIITYFATISVLLDAVK